MYSVNTVIGDLVSRNKIIVNGIPIKIIFWNWWSNEKLNKLPQKVVLCYLDEGNEYNEVIQCLFLDENFKGSETLLNLIE